MKNIAKLFILLNILVLMSCSGGGGGSSDDSASSTTETSQQSNNDASTDSGNSNSGTGSESSGSSTDTSSGSGTASTNTDSNASDSSDNSSNAGSSTSNQSTDPNTPFVEEYLKVYGTPAAEKPMEGIETSDGGFVVVGYSGKEVETGSGATVKPVYIVKINADGTKAWEQFLGQTNEYGGAMAVIELADAEKSLIVGGKMFDNSGSSPLSKRFLAKLTAGGDIVWSRFYDPDTTIFNGAETVTINPADPNSGAQSLQVAELPNLISGVRSLVLSADQSQIIATGYVGTPNTQENQAYVFINEMGLGFMMALDLEGNKQWEKPYLALPEVRKVKLFEEGYLLGSTAVKPGQNHQDYALIKTDLNGNVLWTKFISEPEKNDHFYDMVVTQDGGVALAGHTLSYGVTTWDYLLMKVNNVGEKQWHAIYGQPRGYDAAKIHDEAYGIVEMDNGDLVIIGGSGDEDGDFSVNTHASGSSDEWKSFLIRTTASGETRWQKVYPEAAKDANNAAEYGIKTSDGGIMIFVDSDSSSESDTQADDANFGFLKLKPAN